MTDFVKNFVGWFKLKPKLDSQNHLPPLFNEGEIWWCKLGENVGGEISGKGEEFARPAIVHTKLSKYMLLVVPLTTRLYHENGTPKAGNRFIKFTRNKIDMLACLNQVKVIDYRRLKNKLGDLAENDFNRVCKGFKLLYANKNSGNK